MKNKYTKREALRIIISMSKEYAKKLNGFNFLFIYRNRESNNIEFFETVFLPRNFQHLTGIEFLNEEGEIQNKSVYFYKKCLKNRITEREIQFKKDGTTPLKLEALPKLVNFFHHSKMVALYNETRPKLVVDRLVGTVSYCLGFAKDDKYYVPSSCLLEDIRNVGNKPSQILAIMSKKANDDNHIYCNLCYKAKGVYINKLNLPTELEDMVELSEED